jgi:hypothetical protein
VGRKEKKLFSSIKNELSLQKKESILNKFEKILGLVEGYKQNECTGMSAGLNTYPMTHWLNFRK